MKEKNESWLLSPHAAYHLELSIDFLHTRPVMDIGANEIPAELLQTWIAPGPKELLIRMADGSAGPNETMPYEVFAAPTNATTGRTPKCSNANFTLPPPRSTGISCCTRRSCESSRDSAKSGSRCPRSPCSTSSITRSPYRPPGSMRGNTAFRPYEMIRRTRTKE